MSYVGLLGKGYILTIMESSTKQYPTSLVLLPEMQHFKADPCPDFIRQLRSIVLRITHMAEDAPFPCPRSWGCVLRGTSQVYPT